jgi:hypothetical protein
MRVLELCPIRNFMTKMRADGHAFVRSGHGTQVGVNRITVGDQTYRFFRSFTHIANVGAVVFATA